MRCCVPFCNISSDNISSSIKKGISFHKFPVNVREQSVWLKALGIQNIEPASDMVCSEHFLNNDVYETESGWKEIRAGAIPAAVQVCMICLNIDRKLFPVSEHNNLVEAYQQLTGHTMGDHSKQIQSLCSVCARRLINFSAFRDESMRARRLMMDLLEKHQLITRQLIENLNHKNQQYNLTVTKLEPNYYDFCIQEDASLENKEIQKEQEGTLVVKKEENYYDPVSIDEDMDFEETNLYTEDSVDQDLNLSNDEYVPNGVTLEVKATNFMETNRPELEMQQMIKEEKNNVLRCPYCSKEFVRKHAFTKHVNMHARMKNQTGGAQSSAKGCQPQADSNPVPSGILSDNYPAGQKVMEEPRLSSELMQPSIVPLIATKNGKKSLLDDAAPVRKSRKKTAKKGQKVKYKQIKILRSHACDLCDFKSQQKHAFDLHMRIHSGEKPYMCKFCGYKTAHKYYLKTHIRTHTGEKPYCCKLCDYKTTNRTSLSQHMITHTGEKPFSCEFCDFKTARRARLVVHMTSHTGEMPYLCDFCAYKTVKKIHLVAHLRTHTGEKPYACKLCDYKCGRYNNYVCHMKNHTGCKPYSCNLCDYKTSQKARLAVHMSIHTGERPYSCGICDYKTAQNSNLKRHLRKHTGDKPYACNLCENKYTQSWHLLKHMKKIHHDKTAL